MKISNVLTVLLLGSALGFGVLSLTAPTQAGVAWQAPADADLALSAKQREQIANLRAAFHDRVKSLDWGVRDGSHDRETLREARELRLALRAEIRSVMTDEQLEHMKSARKTCPHGGRAQPVQTDNATLYL